MANFPIPLNTGETLQRSEENCVHIKNSALGIGYNLVYGSLWLTNQRIVFTPAIFGGTVIYPLSHLTAVARTDVSVSQKIISTPIYDRYNSYNAALKLDFDNNGKDYFIPHDLDGWAAAILEAKSQAPDLSFVQEPPRSHAIEQGNRTVWKIVGIFAAIVVLFMCGVSACVGSTVLLAFINTPAK